MERMSHAARRKRRQAIAAYVKSGKTLSDAALCFNVSVATVRKACGGVGVKSLRGISNTPTVGVGYRVIAELIKTDKTLAQISRELNTTRERVRQIVLESVKAGIPLHSSRSVRYDSESLPTAEDIELESWLLGEPQY